MRSHLMIAVALLLAAPALGGRVLLIDVDRTDLGKAAAAVLAALPGNDLLRLDDAEALAGAAEQKWALIVAVRPDPSAWSSTAVAAWKRLCGDSRLGLVIVGLPEGEEGRKALIDSLDHRSPARVRQHIAARFEGCCWIWRSSTPTGKVLFRRAFDVPEPPSFAPLRVTGDDSAKVWLNGKPLGEIDQWPAPLGIDLAGRLRQGKNVLCVEAMNSDQTGGVIASLRGYSAEGKLLLDEPSGKLWRCSDSGPDNWTGDSFDDSGWTAADEIAPMSQGPWQGNMHDDPGLFRQALYAADASDPIASGLPPNLGRAAVLDALGPAAGAAVVIRAARMPVMVTSETGGRSALIAVAPDVGWLQPSIDPEGCNACWDLLVRTARWAAGEEPGIPLTEGYIPRSALGGRVLRFAARASGLSGGAVARIVLSSSGSTLLKSEAPAGIDGQIRFDLPLPPACDVSEALLLTLTIEAPGDRAKVLASRSGFIALQDVTPLSLRADTARRVFRVDEPIELRAVLGRPESASAGSISGLIAASGRTIRQLPSMKATGGAASWRLPAGALPPGAYTASAAFVPDGQMQPAGQGKFEFSIVQRHGAELLDTPPARRENVLRIISINVNYLNGKDEIGDAHLIVTPAGKTMLIDAGVPGCGTAVVLPFLKAQKIDAIDWMMPSHMHDDHFGGMPQLILSDQLKVRQLVWSPLPYARLHEMESFYADDSEKIMRSIESACGQRGVPMRLIRAGQTLDLGSGVSGEILAAAEPQIRVSNYINNNSVVMLLRYGEFSMMFTGDQGFEEEQRVIGLGRDLSCDVLKIGHHAGAGSTGADWQAAVGAKVGVSPMPKFLSSDPRGTRVFDQIMPGGIRLYRTWEHGNIEIQTDGKRFWVITEKGLPPSTASAGRGAK